MFDALESWIGLSEFQHQVRGCRIERQDAGLAIDCRRITSYNVCYTKLLRVRRQVLIEATIIEVALNEGHEQGIDWSSLVSGGIFEFAGNPLKTAINLRYDRNADPRALISLLDRFGDSRVLSSPRLSVLNNQTALLKVVENYVYFTVKADTVITSYSIHYTKLYE